MPEMRKGSAPRRPTAPVRAARGRGGAATVTAISIAQRRVVAASMQRRIRTSSPRKQSSRRKMQRELHYTERQHETRKMQPIVCADFTRRMPGSQGFSRAPPCVDTERGNRRKRPASAASIRDRSAAQALPGGVLRVNRVVRARVVIAAAETSTPRSTTPPIRSCTAAVGPESRAAASQDLHPAGRSLQPRRHLNGCAPLNRLRRHLNRRPPLDRAQAEHPLAARRGTSAVTPVHGAGPGRESLGSRRQTPRERQTECWLRRMAMLESKLGPALRNPRGSEEGFLRFEQ